MTAAGTHRPGCAMSALHSMNFSKKPLFRTAAFLAVVLLVIVLGWPLPDALTETGAEHSVAILDRHGDVLYEVRKPTLGLKSRIALSQIPTVAVQALLATEDRTFYSHPGVSLRGMSRAAWQNVSTGRVVSGGSTITQQLVRNLLQSKRRDVFYKAYEAYLALRMELKYAKDDILEEYLNTAYFGHQAYGISAAAKTFFGKSLKELSVAENALLIGLLQSPSAYDPFVRFQSAKTRQKRVLQNLADVGELTEQQREEAEHEPLTLSHGRTEIYAPHFVFWLLQRYPEISDGNRSVRTTLDLGLQRQIERIVDNNLSKLSDANVTSAAVVVLDADTGEILAMVGSRDYFDTEHDGAVNVAVSARQPGSALKPFVYALALEKGDTPATTVADIETQFFTQEGNPYVPRNYDYGYHGLVRYREALANSYNIAAVKTLERVGVQRLMSFLRASGISTLSQTPEHYGLALALGDAEVRLLELSQAYGVFARGGRTLEPVALLGTASGEGRQILSEKTAWLITDILADNDARLAEFGPDSPLLLPFASAAKTGTTRNSRDNWTVGFTPQRIVGVWVGNADNSPMKGTSGITGAGPIYHDVMLAAAQDLPAETFRRPSGIEDVQICRLSGLLPTPECPSVLTEHFVSGTQPTKRDDIYRVVQIDRRNGQLAGEACPPSIVEERTFAVFPPELRKWARENGWQQAPTTTSALCGSGQTQASEHTSFLDITRPAASDAFQLDAMVPDKNERIIFEARADDSIRTVEWYVNGSLVGTGKAPDFRLEWQPFPGRFTVEVRHGAVARSTTIEVTE